MCKKNNTIIKIALSFVSIALLLYLLFTFHFIIVRGNSMYPTLEQGNILLGKKMKCIKTGDIVTFKKDYTMIKRIIAREGDIVKISNRRLYINNTLLSNYYCKTNDMVMKINKNEFFVLGDNPNDSYDSRDFGVVYLNEISYVMICKLV